MGQSLEQVAHSSLLNSLAMCRNLRLALLRLFNSFFMLERVPPDGACTACRIHVV